eukprot:CAMPEP_0203678016 /NCGR_PEP_ID=MMETSP0090-20130426/30388_1 /ASSEMBLY_ACC=CAM_ASM_001088 /TAXON_ID=426623 /ORGANISM="Chaetoceros affinis, Strain CCMP159" /LENGTH=1215 /DNA_ID=CAMNT_0050545093 /DNA_START=1 /DNA_END=3648 /DNA_ORIENTATION=-
MSRPGTSPAKGNVPLSPIVELQECVSRLNFIVQMQMQMESQSHNGNGASPFKVSPSKSGDLGEKKSAGTTTTRISNGSGGGSKPGSPINYDVNNDIDAHFVKFNSRQEREMVELLRRIAELVVQGEQRAAADDISISSERQQMEAANNTGSANGNAIFEYFCEANVLGTIVNIVTGAAFSDNTRNDNRLSRDMGKMGLSANSTPTKQRTLDKRGSQSEHILVPSIPIAIQAIQSVSILVQNVARVTSLYFILSNNTVNDLINLPLEYYMIAQQNRDENGNDRKQTPGRRQHQSTTSQSAEISELTTLFISFLKSLAMRMNPETLQFYISYPMLNKNDVDFSAVQFPLYARALEFCNPDVDTFVRVTAMNICLNTLRLATTGNPLTIEGSDTFQQSLAAKINSADNIDKNKHRPDKKVSPDGSSLHLTKALPFRERLAISHYVCIPSNVQGLTSATFIKIGQLCGLLEETIRRMDRIDWTLSELSTNSNDTKKKKTFQIERIKLVKEFQDLAADFQDEFFLLEDLLAVGLVPLNEQIIEMMFGAVVYPLVLQPLQIYTNRDSSTGTTKTNQVADVSLAKAAFFFIGSIYHFISHKPFLHLLLTALFHPLSPDQSKSLIQTDKPTIVQIYENKDVQIKTDKLQNGRSLDCYVFGRNIEASDASQIAGTKLLSECTYVLSPALAQLYEGDMLPQSFRQNSYRRSILACLSGTDGMAVLQPLAIYAVDAILATIKPEILKNIMFGANISPELEINYSHSDSDSISVSNSSRNGKDNYMVEVIASVCRSIMTDIEVSDGLRHLKYNLVASHAICCATMIDKPAKAAALKLMEHRRRESASFMSQAPSRLTKKLVNDQSEKLDDQSTGSKISIDEDLKMDRIFFDPFCDGDKFAVENIVRKQDGNFWDGPAYISVAKDGDMNDFCKLICSDPSAVGTFQSEEAPYRYAANSAVAHLQLDAFTRLLRDNFDTAALKKQRGYLGVSAFAVFNKKCIEGKKNTDRVLLSPLPSPFNSLLFDEEVSSSASVVSSDIPQTGAIVALVGRAAFPCVCEVSKESDSLFSDGEASAVVSDGIKWQSLWMVLMGKYMILAEPVKKDSGGNGRVITSSPLCCIAAEKDESAEILQSPSPARRLLLTHFSPDTKPPGLFIIDTSDKDELVNNDDVQITRSVMDLWFEDSNAAAKALKALNSRIVKARSRRGHKIREALAQHDKLRFQTLFNG